VLHGGVLLLWAQEVVDGGEAVGAAKRRWPWFDCRQRGYAPLFGQGHKPVGPAQFHYFLKYPKLVETFKI
jgi:hypothetical protein